MTERGTTANFEALKAHILPMSKASTFDAARREWRLFRVEVDDDFDNCPCGHEIKELCYIRNVLTRHETYVGNVCVNPLHADLHGQPLRWPPTHRGGSDRQRE